MKTVLYFNDIDCIECSKEIEEEINKVSGINSCVIDYLKKRVYVDFNNNIINNIDILIDIINNLDLVVDEKVIFMKKTYQEEEHSKTKLILFIIGTIIFVISSILYFIKLFNNILYLILFISAYLFICYDILIKSFKEIFHGKIFNESFLMILSSILAFVIGEYFEACMLMFLYNIGEMIQDAAVESQQRKIAGLSVFKVDQVTCVDGSIKNVREVNIGDEIIINLGEIVPLDGIIIKGSTTLDMTSLTGESIPVNKNIDDEVLSGSKNLSNSIILRVSKEYTNSTSYKIQELIEESSSKKSKTEEFINRFSKIYTPVVISLAVLLFIIQWLFFKNISINNACKNAIVFLVSSCPCALIISVPLAVVAGIGKCSTKGILIKGGNYLEALSKTKTICFDKTGTLTKGNFEVVKVECFDNNNLDLLKLLTYNIERYSNHPISKVLKEYCKSDDIILNNIQEIPGKGLTAIFNNKEVVVGNNTLFDNLNNINNLNNIKITEIGTIIYVSYDHNILGYFVIRDMIKEDSKELINSLNNINIESIMLTGDNETIAGFIGQELKINKIYSSLLPQDKLNILSDMIQNKKTNTTICFVGDGINDAPSISQADVGISIGSTTHKTITEEQSDIVIMNDQMMSIYYLILISKYTRKIMIQNIIIALGIKLLVMLFACLNLFPNINMYLGVLADVGVCLLCIINSLRIIIKKYK